MYKQISMHTPMQMCTGQGLCYCLASLTRTEPWKNFKITLERAASLCRSGSHNQGRELGSEHAEDLPHVHLQVGDAAAAVCIRHAVLAIHAIVLLSPDAAEGQAQVGAQETGLAVVLQGQTRRGGWRAAGGGCSGQRTSVADTQAECVGPSVAPASLHCAAHTA